MDHIIKPTYLHNNKLHFIFSETCQVLNMSASTLNRICNKRLIRYQEITIGKIFAPEWLDEYYERMTVAPRKTLR